MALVRNGTGELKNCQHLSNVGGASDRGDPRGGAVWMRPHLSCVLQWGHLYVMPPDWVMWLQQLTMGI